MSANLASVLADNPGAIVEEVAKEHRVTTRDVVQALPQAMRKFVAGSAFIDVMKDVGAWGDVTLIIHTDDGIMEFGGPGAGRRSRARLLQRSRQQGFSWPSAP